MTDSISTASTLAAAANAQQPAAPAQPKKRARFINPAAEAWSSFQESTADHKLTILHEQGLYRHFRMAAPGTRWYSWDIITWPGHLATSGDIAEGLNLHRSPVTERDFAEGLTFERMEDMIAFFALGNRKRSYYTDGAPSIDFRYWAEKLQGDQRSTTREYKHEIFLKFVTDTLTERLEDDRDRSLTQARVDELISEAKELEAYEMHARAWLADLDEEFPDSWEDDFTDFTFHFQVACYAIDAAVQAYLDHTTSPQKEAQP